MWPCMPKTRSRAQWRALYPILGSLGSVKKLSLTSMFHATYRMLEDIGCRLQDSPPRPAPSAKHLTLPSANAAPSVTQLASPQPAMEASSARHQSGAASDLRRQDSTTSGPQLSVPEGALDSRPVPGTSSSRYCCFTHDPVIDRCRCWHLLAEMFKFVCKCTLNDALSM